MRSSILCFCLVLSVAGAAHAQVECAGVVPIACGDPAANYPIGYGGYPGGSLVCGASMALCNGTVFSVTIPTTQEITVHLDVPITAATHLYLFEDCQGTQCLDHLAVTQHATDWPLCLPAGTYYIAMLEQTCLFYTYDFSITCGECTGPVATETSPWGSVKTMYR